MLCVPVLGSLYFSGITLWCGIIKWNVLALFKSHVLLTAGSSSPPFAVLKLNPFVITCPIVWVQVYLLIGPFSLPSILAPLVSLFYWAKDPRTFCPLSRDSPLGELGNSPFPNMVTSLRLRTCCVCKAVRDNERVWKRKMLMQLEHVE